MDIGFGTTAALWLLSGVLFWGGFVALGLDFRAVDQGESADSRTPGSSARAFPIPSATSRTA